MAFLISEFLIVQQDSASAPSLDVLVKSEQMRFQKFAEAVSANARIS